MALKILGANLKKRESNQIENLNFTIKIQRKRLKLFKMNLRKSLESLIKEEQIEMVNAFTKLLMNIIKKGQKLIPHQLED